MTNEHKLIFETEIAIPFTCAEATGILKGTVLQLTDPMTAIKASGSADIGAGILAEEKIAGNGHDKASVYRRGIFRGIASGSITVGDPLCIAGIGGLNYLYKAATNAENIFGIALETASDEETFFYELNPTGSVLT